MHLSVNYISSLILSKGKKSCVQMGKFLEVSHDSLQRALSNPKSKGALQGILLSIAHYFAQQSKEQFFIIDDTAISKRFARVMEGIATVYNSLLGKPSLGFSIVVLSWSNGKVSVPIAFEYWFSNEIVKEKEYKKKQTIACELVATYKSCFTCDFILLDGLYCKREVISFLNSIDMPFEMRMYKNRSIRTSNGIKAQIKEHPKLKLNRNQKVKTVTVFWYDYEFFVTSCKRRLKGEPEIVYLVSNQSNLSPHEHLRRYTLRWHIEMCFRTTKQSLGLEHCSARKIEHQRVHILHVFAAYALLQVKRSTKKVATVEDAIKLLRDLKLTIARRWIRRSIQIFGENA